MSARKHINEHCVVHDYGLQAMVKTAYLVSKSVACHQHQRELVHCHHKMCLPDLQSLWTGNTHSRCRCRCRLCMTQTHSITHFDQLPLPMVGNIFNACLDELGADPPVSRETDKRIKHLFCLRHQTISQLILKWAIERRMKRSHAN